MRIRESKYYLLNAQGTKWVLSTLTPNFLSYKWIKLYNEDLSFKGIGMYPKKNNKLNK